MILNIAGDTDTGLARPNNEDSFYILANRGLLVVADGMGGHNSGEVASKIAVDTIRDFFLDSKEAKPFIGKYQEEFGEDANLLGSSIRLANMAIYDVSGSRPEYHGMGTTIAAVMVKDRKMSIAHVGDSRVYLIRAGDIEQLTDDHSVAFEQVKKEIISKEEAEMSTMRNMLTRALGIAPNVEVDLSELSLMPGDALVLCSDGLYSMVPEEDILSVVMSTKEPKAACATLIEKANENGGRDNITVITAYIMKKKWFTSVLNFIQRFRR